MHIINISYPTAYNGRKVYCCENLNKELYEIIEKSGYREDFTRKYFQSLKFLLLTAFEEKNSSDYKRSISEAIKIIKEINKE